MEQRSGVIENSPAFEEASGTQGKVVDNNGPLTFINASPKATKELNVDGFLDVVGEYGCFQKLLTVLLGIMLFPFALNDFIIVFTAVDPEWRCVANSSICHFNGTFSPQDIRRCQMRRSGWEYTQTNEFSIVTAFDLACGKGWMVNLAQSVVFLGAIIGAIFLGWYSDNYGRKKVVFVCCFLITLMNFLSSFMPSIIWFIVLRFCSGFFTPSVLCLFVMLTEFVGNKKRAFAGNLFWQFYSVALCALSLKAYFITSWKILIWTCSLPYFILMVIYLFVPESVRWLRLKEKADEAVEIFQRIAKWNRRQLDSSMTLSKVVSDTEVESKTNPFDLFRPKEIAATTLLLMFVMFTNSLVFFGLSLASSNLGTGSISLNFFLINLVDFPANALATNCCDRFGRKKAVSIPLTISGVLTFLSAFAPNNSKNLRALRITCGILGKFFVSISFNSIMTLAVEAYPTNLRSVALGLMSTCIYIGAASAPWVAKGLSNLLLQLPFYVMGSLGFLAGISCYFLPETKGVSMKESRFDVKTKCVTFENANTI